MVYIFTYGSLQQEDIQFALYGRTLKGHKDYLPGHVLLKERVFGQYPVIQASKEKSDGVHGMAYQLSEQELAKTDSYEGDNYIRKKVRLKSGEIAWVYVKNPTDKSIK